MIPRSYYSPTGGHPPETQLLSDRAVFTEAYAVIPKGVLQDIVASYFPHWKDARAWVLARPMTGFAETFSHYIMEVPPGGGSDHPEPNPAAQAAIFVTEGQIEITVHGAKHVLEPGGFAYLPAGSGWRLHNSAVTPARFHWVRKRYVPAPGVDWPDPIFANEKAIEPTTMPGYEGRWSTTRFVDSADMRHDMHMTIVNFEPGGAMPFTETHVMEHGLYVLEGKGVYRLNRDWVEVEAGDYMWLRAFCPQACYAGGPGRFRYLLYKDVHRHPALDLA